MKGEITNSEKYGPAMKITDRAEADAYFEQCVQHCMSLGKSRAEAEAIERCNLAYCAGQFGDATRERVERVFRCEHPYFGSIAKTGPISAELAYELGFDACAQLMAKAQKERTLPIFPPPQPHGVRTSK